MQTDNLGIADPSSLTDADWAEIDRLKRAYEVGGHKAFNEALKKLDDPVLGIRVIGAFYPAMVREAIKDAMAEHGVNPRRPSRDD
jgi:hypothetical protein